jgi:hypothetical protein
MQCPKPPGRSLMNVRGNAASRGMTAHDRIRLIGPFAEYNKIPKAAHRHWANKRQPRPGKLPAGVDHFGKGNRNEPRCAADLLPDWRQYIQSQSVSRHPSRQCLTARVPHTPQATYVCNHASTKEMQVWPPNLLKAANTRWSAARSARLSTKKLQK